MPQPTGSRYWDPNQYLDDWGNTPLGLILMEQSPDVAFYRYGRTLGVPDDQSAFARWFRQQFPQFALGYGAFTVSQPLTANIRDYTASLGDYASWLRQFQAQDARLRGEDPASRGGGPVRWVDR